MSEIGTRSTPISQIRRSAHDDVDLDDDDASEFSLDAPRDAGAARASGRGSGVRSAVRQRAGTHAPRRASARQGRGNAAAIEDDGFDDGEEDDDGFGGALEPGTVSRHRRQARGGGGIGDIARAMMTRAFLQAVVLAFLIILAVSMTPLSSALLARAPFLQESPWAHPVLNAIIAALAVTALRPPPVE